MTQKMLVFRMPSRVPGIEPRDGVIEIRQGIESPDSLPWGDEILGARRASGSRLFALQVDGHLVSYAWVSAGPQFPAGELRRNLISETPLVWIWDCVTRPEHRGCGYFPELIRHLANEAGPRSAVMLARADNASIVRGITKAGFQPWLEIAATRWMARIRELQRFDGRLRLSPAPIFPLRFRMPQRVAHWLLEVFNWDIGPYSGS